MDPSSPWLIPLRDMIGLGRGLIGGKAQRLAQLAKAGFRTPEGFCITTEAYRSFLERNHLAPVIRMELGRKPLDAMRWEEIWDAALRIRSRLAGDGVIETTYTFRDGDFDGPEKRFTPRGWVHDHETNAEWRMQFLWPFKSAYLIVYLDEDYEKTIIGVPDRDNVWIMSRNPQMSEAEYQRMLNYAATLGYDVAKVKRVPQRWPAE